MVSSKFDSFSARPPTPPKDAHDDLDAELAIDDALELLQDPFGTQQALAMTAAEHTLDTPGPSPPSSSPAGSTASSKKRVNFELQASTIAPGTRPSNVGPWTPHRSSPLRPLPQTRVSNPLKSILKPTDPTSSPLQSQEGVAALQQLPFSEMLESTVKMLAQDKRPAKVDAYLTLNGALQAYEQVPDLEALFNKMGLFMQFIMRDVQAVGISGNGLDSQVINLATRFLLALLRLKGLKSAFTDEFCSWIIDHSISAISDPGMPKAVINIHLALLMHQCFDTKIITTARVEKILDALDAIHKRVSGFSVQAYRIRVYRKFIMQKPDVMTKHTERWFKHVLAGTLSPSKDIQRSALDTAISTAKIVRSHPQITNAILAIMNRVKAEDGDSFGKIYAQGVANALKKEHAELVPQIWGSITACLNRQSLLPSHFTAAREWLQLTEIFICSEIERIRPYANIAFIGLVYAVDVAIDTPEFLSKMLVTLSQKLLSPPAPRKKMQMDAATFGYMMLLYYAFAPAASHSQLSRYWKEFVADFWTSMIHRSSSTSSRAVAACRVVTTLLRGSGRTSNWDQHAALELQVKLESEKEPKFQGTPAMRPLNPQWVRKHLCMVLQFIETLLDAAPWTLGASDNGPVKPMWISLLDSLVEASCKEVMATSETKDATAHIVNMLRRVWDRHTAALATHQNSEDSWAEKFSFLVTTVVQKLGALQFSDKSLTRNVQNQFEVSTPSHRSRPGAQRLSPLLYFVDLLMVRSEGKIADTDRSCIVQRLIEPCFAAQNSRLAKLELLRDCSAVVGSVSTGPAIAGFWAHIGKQLKACLTETPADAAEPMSRQPGKEYDMVVELLSLGSLHLLQDGQGTEILRLFAEIVRKEAGEKEVGESAVAVAVIETVSASVLASRDGEHGMAYVPYLCVLLKNFPTAVNRRNLEQAKHKLYPSAPAPARGTEIDPFNHLYTAITSFGNAVYHDFDKGLMDTTRQFLEALASSIRRCPVTLIAAYLRKIQNTVALWIEDPDKQLKKLRSDVLALWQAVCEGLEKIRKRDSSLLSSLEPLLCAGFSSRRRRVVETSVKSWNSTFGKEEGLRYPAQLEKKLHRLSGAVELLAPSLEGRERLSTEPLSFDESDDSIAESTPRIRAKSARPSNSPFIDSAGSRRRFARKRHPTAKLRHDNSQIHFEPILSSPAALSRQESQVLTDRQREVFERQRDTSTVYSAADPGWQHFGGSSQPQDVNSDALTADDLPTPTRHSRSPLKALAAMGPMDAYLGSSPTPYARSRGQQTMGGQPESIGPTAMHTVTTGDDVELGSSPPRMAKMPGPHVGNGVQHPETTNNGEQSLGERDFTEYDEGTTIEDDVFRDLRSPVTAQEPKDRAARAAIEMPSEDSSSAIEDQLERQFDADISVLHDEEQPKKPTAPPETSKDPEAMLLDAPSFVQQASADDTPVQTSAVRRSTRHSVVTSPAKEVANRKRARRSLSESQRSSKKPREEDKAPLQQSKPAEEPECVIVEQLSTAPPKRGPGRPPKRKPQQTQVVPETVQKQPSRKRAALRSSSSANDLEVGTDEIVGETPLLKRSRRSVGQDVSQAKSTESPAEESSQSKRLSHVRVSPRHTSSRASSVAGEDTADVTQAQDGDAISPAGEDEPKAAPQAQPDTTQSRTEEDITALTATPNRSFTERVILTPRSILDKLRKMISDCSQIVLGREEERGFDDALFDLRRAVHAAGRRGQDGLD
ncbi:hypothetical protein M011DRAFT_484473 [Sporormia fimetaria CBS 119925]|uniref:Telomere-associated protein Rif1 N-terminal domain-containing protein n=1 Tax=Sporormia fimetaria CBS 119925 TaxID=1340428 RepID=A0A6A6VGN6_9PLEO|nr:hypothetical protein M011DRAFT_484473 [Sporormia fimetaria CBS 119925]